MFVPRTNFAANAKIEALTCLCGPAFQRRRALALNLLTVGVSKFRGQCCRPSRRAIAYEYKKQPGGTHVKNYLRLNTALAGLPAMVIGVCLASMPAMAEDCVVKIGNVGPMTGGGASWGLAMKAGIEFEAAVTNAAGGLQMGDKKCKVEVVAVDSQSTAAGAAA